MSLALDAGGTGSGILSLGGAAGAGVPRKPIWKSGESGQGALVKLQLTITVMFGRHHCGTLLEIMALVSCT